MVDNRVWQDTLAAFLITSMYVVFFGYAVALVAAGSFMLGLGWAYLQYRRHRNWQPGTGGYTYRRGGQRG